VSSWREADWQVQSEASQSRYKLICRWDKRRRNILRQPKVADAVSKGDIGMTYHGSRSRSGHDMTAAEPPERMAQAQPCAAGRVWRCCDAEINAGRRPAWQRRLEITLPLAGPATALIIELLLL
jgi:hypothetical protein